MSKLSTPSFLAKFLTESELDETLVKVFMPDSYPVIYRAYMVLSEVETLDRSHIVVAEYDEDKESVVLEMTKAKHAKDIKKCCDGKIIEYGKHNYMAYAKCRESFVIISFEKIKE